MTPTDTELHPKSSMHPAAVPSPLTAAARTEPAGASWFRREHFAPAGAIAAGIVGVAILLSVFPPSEPQTHNFLHNLAFIPILAAGMLFGWRGAAVSVALSAIVQAPHLLLTWRGATVYTLDQVMELVIFGVAGIVAGLLADRERSQKEYLATTKRELEHVYEELRRNVERLRRAERLSAAGQLSAGLAHEIRNPLAGIAGAAGLLRRAWDRGENAANARECLEIIDKESHRLDRLLSSFLEFAKPRPPRIRRTGLRPVLESVAGIASHSQQARDIRFDITVEAGLGDVACDPEQLKQVLLNLVINSIQAMEGRGTIRIEAAREASEEAFSIAVTDTGCGVPPDELPRIFDPFYTSREGGTGLGLPVAANIVEQHGGQIAAENDAGGGLTVRVVLPMARENE
ncbi:MAG: ATP-binding protein [Bryobacteraceae bacterium]